MDEIDRQCPVTEISIKKLKPIWVDDYLLHLVNERDRQFKKARRTNVHSDWADAKIFAQKSCEEGHKQS